MKIPKTINSKLPRITFLSRVPPWKVSVICGLVLLVSVFAGLRWYQQQAYVLSLSEQQLLPSTSVDKSKISLKDGSLTYNRLSEDTTGGQTMTMGGTTNSDTPQGYSVTLPKDPEAGIAFSDAKGELPVKLIPQDQTGEGKYIDGRMLYPSEGGKSLYTLRRNGIKADILLTKAPGDDLTYSWKLELGDKLEAKLHPDGSVGLYSASPYLYGNLQVSDAKSQALVDKARQTGTKDTLAYLIPAPYIKELVNSRQPGTGNKEQGANNPPTTNYQPPTTNYEDVKFSLKDNILTLTATNLKAKTYPLSIDPTIVVTTTADFRTGTDDGNINYSTANEINRGNISLGTVGGTWSTTNTFTTARDRHTSVAYNGYLYVIGGIGGSYQNDVQYAPINSGGTVGTWNTTTAFTTARGSHTSVAYNGYLYVIGGDSGTYRNDVQYAPLNADGTVGTWNTTTAFTTARYDHTSVAYNGYLYVIGGYSGSNQNGVQYAPINADGTVGSWTATTGFTTARYGHTSVAYNGYLYVIGGYGAGWLNDVQYAPINADGTVGSWTATTGFTTARTFHESVVYNGYLYVIGGSSSGPTYHNDVQYAPLNANGTVGTWNTTTAFTTARRGHTSVTYNGYLYVIGGYSGGSVQNDVQYNAINAGTPSFGTVASWTATTAFTTARDRHTSIAYNGYLYVIGGYDGTNYYNDVQYAPINADGTVGTWNTTTAFTTARYSHTSVAYNGYLYVIGGNSGSNQNGVQYAPINADGTVGSWTATTGFTTARYGHTSVAYNGYLYVIGGYPGGSPLNDVQYAPINANGTVGSWTATTAFTTDRFNHTSVAYNGYLYVIGGSDGGSPLNNVQYAPLNANGTIGTWNTTTAFTTARYSHTSVAYNGYLYVIGGYSGSYQNDVQYAPLNANGTIGTWNTTTAFTTARRGHNSVATGGYLYVIGGLSGSYQNGVQYVRVNSPEQAAAYEKVIDISTMATITGVSFNGRSVCGESLSYKIAGSNGVYGAVTKLPFVLAGTSYSISTTDGRYVWLQFKLNDSTCGTTSQITDITLTYVNAPAAPTLSAPTSSATNVATAPQFQLRTTDVNNDYLRYEIVLYQSNCSTVVRTIDQTSSQTGWTGQDAQSSTAYAGSSVIGSSTLATHNYQPANLTGATTYCWKARAIDPGGSNTWGDYSSTRTFTTSNVSSAPTLISPADSATAISGYPTFRLRASDAENDYLRYKIEICSNSDCSSIWRTVDQTASQAGWSGQDASGNTAYVGNSNINNSTIAAHLVQPPGLSASTQYWWRAYAIDPAGSNTWSSPSSIQSFTIDVAKNVEIRGGSTIQGGGWVY